MHDSWVAGKSRRDLIADMDNLGLFPKFLTPNRLELWSIFPYFMEWGHGLTIYIFFSFPLGLMAYILFESQNKLTSLFLLRHVIGSLSIFSSWTKRMTCVT